jgi:hypothetical protein
MAASAWSVFRQAKHNLGLGKLDLSGATWKIMLFRSSASTTVTTNISTIGSVGTFTASAGGGDDTATLGAITWTGVASANDSTRRWDVSDAIFTASTQAISNVRYGVIYCSTASADRLLCYAALSTAGFVVTKDSTLTIQMAGTGVFTLA